MTVKLLTEHHLEFLSLKRDYTGWSESTLVKMSHCWKSHVAAQIFFQTIVYRNSIVIDLMVVYKSNSIAMVLPAMSCIVNIIVFLSLKIDFILANSMDGSFQDYF